MNALGCRDAVLVCHGQRVDQRNFVNHDQPLGIRHIDATLERITNCRKQRKKKECNEHGKDRQRRTNLFSPNVFPNEAEVLHAAS
jgi:hypothetical protein